MINSAAAAGSIGEGFIRDSGGLADWIIFRPHGFLERTAAKLFQTAVGSRADSRASSAQDKDRSPDRALPAAYEQKSACPASQCALAILSRISRSAAEGVWFP